MSGRVKQKEYDWKDSNMALFGSDTDKKVKKESAQTEPAWKGAGQKPGVQIWRINQFKVDHEPKEDYGKFFSGDSYIILNTYKEKDGDELLYDVHFWIGKESTQDEYGTAAYKTVELDTLLDDKPVQHREVMNHESSLFKSYFPDFTTMKGGNKTGFRHVEPKEYPPRLFHVASIGSSNKVHVKEVGLFRGNMNDGDVFILDDGFKIYQWNGKNARGIERVNALQYVQKLKSERGGTAGVTTIDKGEVGDKLHDKFKELLKEGSDSEAKDDSDSFTPALFRLSDEGGSLKMTLMNEGKIPKSMLNESDVFIADTGKEVFVYVGKSASEGEKKNGLTYAHNYLVKTKHPLAPVTVLKGGQASAAFKKILD